MSPSRRSYRGRVFFLGIFSRCLQKSSAFASLEDASVSQIVDVMQYSVSKKGEILCHQGDAADRMFVIVSGECAVHIDGTRVAMLKELDVLCFLMRRAPSFDLPLSR